MLDLVAERGGCALGALRDGPEIARPAAEGVGLLDGMAGSQEMQLELVDVTVVMISRQVSKREGPGLGVQLSEVIVTPAEVTAFVDAAAAAPLLGLAPGVSDFIEGFAWG